jgi:hypothetical protein
MSASHKCLLAFAFWVLFVVGLAYLRWWPGSLHLEDLQPDERAFSYRLPEDGVQTQMIDSGMKVSLVISGPPAFVVEHARVLAKTCRVEIQSTTRVSACYAAIAVPKTDIAAITSAAGKVSIWVEKR